MAPHHFAHQIANNIHKLDIDVDTIYRNFLDDESSDNYGKLYRILNEKKVD